MIFSRGNLHSRSLVWYHEKISVFRNKNELHKLILYCLFIWERVILHNLHDYHGCSQHSKSDNSTRASSWFHTT